jgi:pimeloyl-ACP methyl ester carboxylesterase
LQETDPAVLLNDYKAVDGFDVRDRLAQVQTPTLIIGGSVDRMIPFAQSETLYAGIAGSKLVKIEGGGHLMALEQPQTVADAVQSWLIEVYP